MQHQNIVESTHKGVILSLLCSACVGLHLIFSKVALAQTSPFFAVAIMAAASLIFSTAPYLRKKTWPEFLSSASRRTLIYGFLHSLLASGGMLFTWSGLVYLNPTIASFIGRSEVIISVLCAIIFLNERLSFRKICGFALGLTGVFFLSLSSYIPSTPMQSAIDLRGVSLIFAGAACYGSCEIFAVKCIRFLRTTDFVFLRSFFNFLIIAGVVLISGQPLDITSSNFGYLAAAAFLGPYLARHLFMNSVKLIPLSIAVGINQTQPLFAALFGCFFSMALPTKWQWLGSLCIIGGCLLLINTRIKLTRFAQLKSRQID